MTVSLHSDILQGIVIMTGNMGPLGIGFALQLEFLLHKQHPPKPWSIFTYSSVKPQKSQWLLTVAVGLSEVIRC